MSHGLCVPVRAALLTGFALAATGIVLAGCNPAPATQASNSGGQSFAGSNGLAGTTAGFGGTTFAGSGAAGQSGSGGTIRDAGLPGAGGRATSGKSPMPCNVVEVLRRNCQSCHAAQPLSGVPMALLSWEDTQKPSVSNPQLSVHQLIATRTHSTTSPMPPPPQMPLSPADQAILDAWLNGGALVGTDASCAPASPDAGIMVPTGDVPPGAEKCYILRAHGQSSPTDTSPWPVTNEHYACFYFDAPWPGGAQGVYFAPAFDAHPEVVHHWLVYLDENDNQPNGNAVHCLGSHPSSPTLVAGWAPGADNYALPNDVGMNLTSANHKILMEVHYFYKGGTTVPSNTGVKICTVEKNLRPNTATVSWLGTENIALAPHAPGNATGRCTPQYNADIHILRSWPHMHQMGVGMDSIINRVAGTQEPMMNGGTTWPFNFNSQVSHSTPFVIHPGDSITTTCHYNNTSDQTIGVGYDTASEMCFNFVTAYPAKALLSKNLFGGSTSLTAASTACLQ